MDQSDRIAVAEFFEGWSASDRVDAIGGIISGIAYDSGVDFLDLERVIVEVEPGCRSLVQWLTERMPKERLAMIAVIAWLSELLRQGCLEGEKKAALDERRN